MSESKQAGEERARRSLARCTGQAVGSGAYSEKADQEVLGRDFEVGVRMRVCGFWQARIRGACVRLILGEQYAAVSRCWASC